MSSPESRPIIFAPRALIDIQDIFLHGVVTWGEQRARNYDAKIREAIQRLAVFPELGRTRDDVLSGCRSLVADEHLVFYEIANDSATGDAIRIIRILHKSRHAAGEVRE